MHAESEDTHLKWSRYVWRRGTVPIWWGVEMKNGGLGDTDVVIAATNPYKGIKRCASNSSSPVVSSPTIAKAAFGLLIGTGSLRCACRRRKSYTKRTAANSVPC